MERFTQKLAYNFGANLDGAAKKTGGIFLEKKIS